MKYDIKFTVFGAWRSLVAHLLWEQGVGGSNPLAPTIFWEQGVVPLEKRDHPDQPSL